jgi:CheY-like chemotaxis protein
MITIQAGYALVIDDEPANRDFVERLLQTASFKVIGASTGAAALESTAKLPELALALVDHELPDMTGLDLIRKLRSTNPDTLLVMATMHDDRDLIDQAFSAGIDVFLVKPHGFMELYRRLKEVDSDTSLLRAVIIDQYGPRPYKGKVTGRRITSETQATAETTSQAPTEPKTVPVVETPVVVPVALDLVNTPATTEIKPEVKVETPAAPTTPTEAESNAPVSASALTPDQPKLEAAPVRELRGTEPLKRTAPLPSLLADKVEAPKPESAQPVTIVPPNPNNVGSSR